MDLDNEKVLITQIKQSPNEAGALDILTINPTNECIIHEFCFDIPADDVPTFFKFIPAFMKREVKAVILQISEFTNPQFPTNLQFRLMIAEEFEKHGIKYCFIDTVAFLLTQLLVAANLDLKNDETLLIASAGEDTVSVFDLTKCVEGYRRPLLKRCRIVKCPSGYNPTTVKDDILGSSNPKRIILSSATPNSSPLMKDLRNKILKSKKLIAFENVDENYQFLTMEKIADRIYDPNLTKYFVIPIFDDLLFVENERTFGECRSNIRLTWNYKDAIPGKQNFIAPRSKKPYYLGLMEGNESTLLTTLPVLEEEHHKVLLTLAMDENLIPKLTQEPYIDPLIEKLPEKITEKMSSSKRIPIIGFLDNSSIICLWNQKENGYKFCQNWNGIYGKDLLISFDKEKPTFFDEARKSLETNPSFVVYDFIPIMSSFRRIIHAHPDWQFKITSDEENEVLLEIDNFDGTRKAATPEFYMAMLLKEHLKVIKEEIGTKPAEIGVIFFDKMMKIKFFIGHLLKKDLKNLADCWKLNIILLICKDCNIWICCVFNNNL